jgi:hypothetical protein
MKLLHWYTAFLIFLAGPVAAQDYTWPANDPRFERRPEPASWDEFVTRFLTRYEAVQPPQDLLMSEEQVERFAFEVTRGTCYAIAGLGMGITDLDIEVRYNGALVGQDVWPDPYPVATWCATFAGSVEVTITAFWGHGTARYAIYAIPETLIASEGPFDQLSNRMLMLQSRAAPRWIPAQPQWRSRLDSPGHLDFEFTPEPGRCYAALGVADAGVVDLDQAILDGSGTALDGDFTLDPNAATLVCAASDSPLTVRTWVVSGRGSVAVQLLTEPAQASRTTGTPASGTP